MAHIFISYSKKDIERARFIRVSLQNAGIPVWMDEEGLSIGDQWHRTIEAALNESSAVVVLMSPNSNNSDWVNREIQYAEDLKLPIYPILLSGQPFFRLRDKQYEDMSVEVDTLPTRLLNRLRSTFSGTQNDTKLYIEHGNVLETHTDVLVLKYAQSFHGADLSVKDALARGGVSIDTAQIKTQGYLLLDTHGAIGAKQVLLIQTRRLRLFDYSDVRSLTTRAFQLIQTECPTAQTVVLTIHGVGTGLDEAETFRAQLGGVLDAIKQTKLANLDQITFVEINKHRWKHLQELATDYLAKVKLARAHLNGEQQYHVISPQKVNQTDAPADELEEVAPHVPSITALFPTDEALEDVYYYGILRPAGMQGFLCENITTELNLQDAEDVARLTRFIDRAQMILVYAAGEESTGGLPASLVFQLGMAYAKNKPIVCITPHDEEVPDGLLAGLPPDIQWLSYARISDLERAVLNLLKTLK